MDSTESLETPTLPILSIKSKNGLILCECGLKVIALSFHSCIHTAQFVHRYYLEQHCTMSGGLDVLAMKEDDITKLLAASTHLGDANVDFQMAQYVYKVKSDGQPIINLRKTWEKLMLAARVLACIENPNDICVLSNRPFGQVCL